MTAVAIRPEKLKDNIAAALGAKVRQISVALDEVTVVVAAADYLDAMRLLRDSGGPVKMIAVAGSYQQMLQGKVYQMLRLTVDESLGAIPEISANKYMLWIRFMTQGGESKPKAFEVDIPSRLSYCE